jgi:hypothetical protein
MSDLRVRLASGGFLPQSFRWEGHSYRVLAVHSVKTYGAERRYRVASTEGNCELALDLPSGTWRVRHWPNWLSRALYRWQHGARYPLPAWRRRRTIPARVTSTGRPRRSTPASAVTPAPRIPAPAVNHI